ncbi:MAG: hypothetical protein RLZZ200_2579 [Pseudomonadota bacterium]|jgi:predicted Zn-dependent protease
MSRYARIPLLTLLGLSGLLVGCGVNPVTGRNELQFVSEADEIQIGAKQYVAARQSEGGDLTALPELSVYVNEVGQRLAAVADRKLPYEFTVLNSSVPNAWALPGGKIAVNRGLLTQLHDEAELAAVLGHEIVHAAARHGAKSQERSVLLQAVVLAGGVAAAVSDADPKVVGVAMAGAGVGTKLVQQRFGRDQELEADAYGMRYMQRAGYDALAAVDLQQTFVKLSAGKQGNWLEGLFASHPPSQERVDRNRELASKLGKGGDRGAERFAARLGPLMQLKPAYDKYDQALAALGKKDFATARWLSAEAARLAPKEGRFAELQGDVETAERNPRAAQPLYERAIALDPSYYGGYLGAGISAYRNGDRVKSESFLRRSAALLPTGPAALYLGHVARDKGDRQAALALYGAAAKTGGEIGKAAAAEAARLEGGSTAP